MRLAYAHPNPFRAQLSCNLEENPETAKSPTGATTGALQVTWCEQGLQLLGSFAYEARGQVGRNHLDHGG